MEKILEIVKLEQVIKETEYNSFTIRSPFDAAEIVEKLIGNDDREVFLVIGLNTKNQMNIVNRCHIGTINSSLVSCADVMKSLILSNCCSYIVAHNHPSGRSTLEPSREDIQMTERLYQAGKLLGIELLDHLIVSGKKHISLKEKEIFSRFM
ncbi:JAB domain-containing protein [Heyndrickxia ginsengihumi]|uniref:JAB domain-containing protein n=1 Tax=Heyndrickxia ginsengihumi TaxID=363870 RepID=UPI00046E9912|nr:JAB domain-containing protein [Heyndrickxia ginsengihumi]